MSRGGVAGSPLSERRRSRGGTGCLVGFFTLFAVVGLAVFLPFFAWPAARAVASRGWDEVPCTILSSAVGVHESSDGDPTYSIDVAFEYQRGGASFRSERYSFFDASSSGRDGKEAVVAALPPGARTVCYVDPADPASAVLERSPFPWVFIGCFPLVFVLVGVGGVYGVLRSGRRRRRLVAAEGERRLPPASGAAALAAPAPPGKAPAGLAEAGLEAWAPPGPVLLEAGGGRVGRLVGLAFATVFWNGIVGVFVWLQWREGTLLEPSCVSLFLIPFVLVGLLLLLSVPHQVLALWNPRPVVDLSRVLFPGAEVTLGWRFRGAASRLRRLRITVEGREEATYRRGTTTTTDKRVFARIVVVDTADPLRLVQGSAPLVLPPDTMHSFTASHNKVVWELVVDGEIGFWPDVADRVPLHVYPREMT